MFIMLRLRSRYQSTTPKKSNDDISMISLNTIITSILITGLYIDPKKTFNKSETISKYIIYSIITASSSVVVFKIIKILR